MDSRWLASQKNTKLPNLGFELPTFGLPAVVSAGSLDHAATDRFPFKRSGVPVCFANYQNLPYLYYESRYQKSENL